MGSEWKKVTLQDVVSILGDGLHGTPKYDEEGEYFFINGNNLSNGRIVMKNKTKRASKGEYEKYKKELNDRTILVSINGTLGNIAIYNGEKCFLGKSACYFNVLESVNKSFIRYVVTNNHFQRYINNLAHGTTIKNVSLQVMRDYSFPLPPLPEQRAIAHILGTLDDKIELNRKMNETLEGIARALFKSWFVDFDPVRAKMDGKKPAGMDDETAELFPDELVWNEELGKEVPKGWGVKPFYECVNILSGGTPKTSISEYWNGDVPWVSARDVKNANGSFILEPEKTISESGVDHSNAKLLPKHTTVITARGTVGSYCILGREMTINQTNYGFKGRDGYPDFFVFFSLQNIIDLLKQHAYGTIFDTITRKTFQNVFMIKPCSNLIKEFEKIVTPLMESIHGNIEQGISLVAIRDTLLQKLISGQLRIEEPEMFLKGRGLWR